jgi:fused signal recognition particle receptor
LADLETVDLETADPETADPETADPETADPETADVEGEAECLHPAEARDYQSGTCAACGAILWD